MIRTSLFTSVFLLVNILSCTVVYGQLRARHEVSVLSSEIKIIGSTNVNRFECELFTPTITDTLNVQSTWSNFNISFDRLELHYPVHDFDCGIPAMTSDFRDILQADQYPELSLKIDDIIVDRASEGFEKLKVEAYVIVTLSGFKRRVLVTDAFVKNHSESDLTLVGKQQVTMTSFGLEPPTRFWGALRVYDELTIAFTIRMSVATKKAG